MNELALFAGAGGGMLGGKLLGWRNVGAVEIGKYQRGVIAQRQNDGQFDAAPVWDDVTTFREDNPDCALYIEILRSVADELAISGGFPCQDISIAGSGDGLEGLRSGLWREMARIIGEIRPAFVLVENSSELTNRGGVRVVGDLASLGYDMRWGVMGADTAGAPHFRDRIWILAHAQRLRRWKFSDPSHTPSGSLRSPLGGQSPVVTRPGGEIGAGGCDSDATGKHGQARASTGKHGIAWVRAESGDHRHNLEDWIATVWLKEGNLRIAGMNVNPDWQDWLMGWPIGHSDLMPLETDRFRQWLDLHGKR